MVFRLATNVWTSGLARLSFIALLVVIFGVSVGAQAQDPAEENQEQESSEEAEEQEPSGEFADEIVVADHPAHKTVRRAFGSAFVCEEKTNVIRVCDGDHGRVKHPPGLEIKCRKITTSIETDKNMAIRFGLNFVERVHLRLAASFFEFCHDTEERNTFRA